MHEILISHDMAKKTVWRDDYWLLLVQAYLRRPKGLKPVYSREMVNLSLELHIDPQTLAKRMQQIDRLDTPHIERLWRKYSAEPKQLARAVRLLRNMNGFGQADEFYRDVQTQETFERDFRPLDEDARFTPAMLILILDLYFQLTPSTMVAQTPEVAALARLLGLTAQDVVQVLDVFQICDPYLERNEVTLSPLLLPCQQLWHRMSDKEPQHIHAIAEEMKAYFK